MFTRFAPAVCAAQMLHFFQQHGFHSWVSETGDVVRAEMSPADNTLLFNRSSSVFAALELASRGIVECALQSQTKKQRMQSLVSQSGTDGILTFDEFNTAKVMEAAM